MGLIQKTIKSKLGNIYISYADLFSKPQTLQTIYQNFAFKIFTAIQLSKVMGITYESSGMRLIRLWRKTWVIRIRKKSSKDMKITRNFWKLSKQSKDYLNRYGSFLNPEGFLWKMGEKRANKSKPKTKIIKEIVREEHTRTTTPIYTERI